VRVEVFVCGWREKNSQIWNEPIAGVDEPILYRAIVRSMQQKWQRKRS